MCGSNKTFYTFSFIDTKYLCAMDVFKEKITSSVLRDLYETVNKAPFRLPTVGKIFYVTDFL